MDKDIVIIEEDTILKKLLSHHIKDFFNNNFNISFFEKTQIDKIFTLKKLDILLINCSQISDSLKTLKEIEAKKTKNILIIFNNSSDRYNNKSLINYKFVVKPFTFKNLFSIIIGFHSNFNDSVEPKIFLMRHLSFKQNKKIIINEKTKEFVHLTEKEASLMKHLYEYKNQVISKKDLLNNVWDFNEKINTHTLETHIYRLKKKIEKIENKVNFSFLNKDGGYLIKYE